MYDRGTLSGGEGMADFVFNPRRAPRAPLRCRAEITGTDGSRWSTETEDIGPRGCQIVAPHRRPKGEQLQLQVAIEGIARNLRVAGAVAWVSGSEPWRLGVSFAEQDSAAALAWYEALLAKNPALAAYKGVPDRISVDATVFLGPPPRLVMDFTAEEIQVLRCVEGGVSVGALRTRLEDIWDSAQHGLFSLIARRHLVLSRGASVLPTAWKEILADLEKTLTPEERERSALRPQPSLGSILAAARTPTPRPLPLKAPPPTASVPVQAAPAPTPPTPAAPTATISRSTRETRAATRAIDAGGSWSTGTAAPEVKHDFQGAGVGWRSQPRPRGADADRLFREATIEAEAGKVDSAIGMLRKALHIAPGDPEIAALLGRLAFRDRSASHR